MPIHRLAAQVIYARLVKAQSELNKLDARAHIA